MSSIDEQAEFGVLHHTPEAILAHPRFAVARKAYVAAVLHLYEHDPFMNRLLMEAARSVVFFTVICLYCAYDEAERATWPTMRLLQDSVAHYGLASARRVEDMVARFVHSGYLDSRAARADRRAHILTPTAKALAHDRDWLAAHYAPVEAMFPDPGYAPPMRRDPAFQKVQRAIGRRMAANAAQMMSSNPAVMLFMGRDAGMMILMKLVELAGEARHISFADFGTRFGISRTHVRKILRDAEREGLVHMSDGTVVLTGTLLAAFDRFTADAMAAHDLMYRMAMREFDAAAASTDTRALSVPGPTHLPQSREASPAPAEIASPRTIP